MTIRAAVAAHVRDNWRELAATVAVLCVVAVVDIGLLQTGHESITARVWDLCAAHPLIAVAGTLLSLYAAYLSRASWPCVWVAGVLAGHLFTVS